jgi:transcriptional regulator MraZ
MPSFSGTYYFTVDTKGRIIIPAPFREIISTNYSTKLYITNAPVDQCIRIYPQEEWSKLQDKVRTKPSSDKHIKFFMRRVIGSAVEIDLDRQGRILIPVALRENAKINGNVVIVGQVERLELWDRDEWDRLVDLSKIDKESMEEGLAGFGF